MLENASHTSVGISHLTCCLPCISNHEAGEHKLFGLQLSSDMILAIGSLPERQCGVRLRVNSDRVRSIHKLSVYSQRAS